MNQVCPCCLTVPYAECCQPFLDHVKLPETAEQLMRSRYTAFTLANMDYIRETHDPKTIETFDLESNKRWAEESTWLGLEINRVQGGLKDDESGIIEFTAHFEFMGIKRSHREISHFRKVDGRWFFEDGFAKPQETLRRTSPKIGRNDECSCGSGKKYKKCCLKVS